MSKVTFIEVSVGELPEWYNEGEHDPCLEDAIAREWRKNPAYADADIRVVYNYQSDNALVRGYDDDGNPVFNRDDHNLDYAFAYAQEVC